MANTKTTKTSGASAEDQARVDSLLANPNRQPAEDKELDQLLHRKDSPVITGDVSVDPVSSEPKTGVTTRDTMAGASGGDNVTRDIDNPSSPDASAEGKSESDATEAGASRAGATKSDEKK